MFIFCYTQYSSNLKRKIMIKENKCYNMWIYIQTGKWIFFYLNKKSPRESKCNKLWIYLQTGRWINVYRFCSIHTFDKRE